jgi:hypothetical protein
MQNFTRPSYRAWGWGMMVDFITQYLVAASVFSSLFIYGMALFAGFTQIAIWLGVLIIKNTIGLHDLYRGFQYYLRSKKNDR